VLALNKNVITDGTQQVTTVTVTLLLQPFYGSQDFVRDYPGDLVPKETFTHAHLS